MVESPYFYDLRPCKECGTKKEVMYDVDKKEAQEARSYSSKATGLHIRLATIVSHRKVRRMRETEHVNESHIMKNKWFE